MRIATAVALTLACLTTPALAGPKPAEIKKAFKSGDAGEIKQMLGALEGDLDDKALKTILKESPRLRTLGVYADLVKTLATAQGDALQDLIKAYGRERKGEMRFLIVDALGNNPDASVEETLAEAIAEDKDPPVRVMAARLMGKRFTTTAVDKLIPILSELEEKDDEERIVKEILAALGNLTGQELSVAQDWKNYWDAHKNSYAKPAEGEGDTKTRSKLIDRMKEQRPAELKTLTRMKDADLLVMNGNDYDFEDVLDVLGLKYKRIKIEDYESGTFDPEKQILLLGCCGSKHTLSDAGIAKLREFVAKGGYVFLSDWHLEKTLAKAFPKVITFLKELPRVDEKTPGAYKDDRGKIKGLDVTIKPFPETAEHPLMRDVFPLNTWEGGSFAWKLHERSHLLNDAKSAVVPLVSCPEVAKHGSSTVAFTFAFTEKGGGRPVTGRMQEKVTAGRVLFVSSHFSDEKDGKEDGYALQQLLLNFIIEKQEQRKNRRD